MAHPRKGKAPPTHKGKQDSSQVKSRRGDKTVKKILKMKVVPAQKVEEVGKIGDKMYSHKYTVGVENHQMETTLLEVTFTPAEAPIAEWIKEARRIAVSGGPIIVTICAYPKGMTNDVSLLAVSTGGNRCLLLPRTLNNREEYRSVPSPLVKFLSEARVRVVTVTGDKLLAGNNISMPEGVESLLDLVKRAGFEGATDLTEKSSTLDQASVALGMEFPIMKKGFTSEGSANLVDEVTGAAVDVYVAQLVVQAALKIVEARPAGGD